MGKFLAGALGVAAAAAIGFYVWSGQLRSHEQEMSRQVDSMNQQFARQNDENNRLRTELAKVQAEEQALVQQNEQMRKAIATVKATGKLPPGELNLDLPYPPK